MSKLRWSVLMVVSTVVACSGSSSPPSGADESDASTGQTSDDGGSGASSSGATQGGSSGGGTTSGGTGSTSSGSSGSSSGSGSTKDAGSTGVVMTTGSGPVIPAASGTCPTLATGTITVMGQSVQMFVGTKQEKAAPILFYWHGTGSTSGEVQAFMSSEITEITGEGGVVASFSTSTAMGQDTGDAVWYTGDFAMADQILACAVKQLNIDTRQIYSAGCSAGGLQTVAMLFARSNYLAAAMPNSGGEAFAGEFPLEGKHVPALVTTHGAMGTDMVVIDFATASATADTDVVSKGGFAVDCNHGGGHCGAPAVDVAAQWQFCKDHPFGVSPEPYAKGLPSSFPSYCTIIK
jgi:poly(3-hydroxybutyrate) depolymerase